MSIDTKKSSIGTDEFEIVKTGIAAMPALSVSDAGVGSYSSGEGTNTIAHGLGYTPGLFVNILVAPALSTFAYAGPYSNRTSGVGTIAQWQYFQAYTDNTYLYLITDILTYHSALSVAANQYFAQYYLLKERIKRAV